MRDYKKPFAVALLAGALLLTGCAKSKTADGKPPLKIPATFASEADKKAFVTKAVAEGYFEESIPLLDQTLAKEPTAHGYSLLGTAQYNMSNYQAAIEAWNKAAEMDSNLAGEMKNNIGNALRDSGKLAEAEASYQEAMDTDPLYWRSAINLASLLKTQGRTAEAIAALERAQSVNKSVEELKALITSYNNG